MSRRLVLVYLVDIAIARKLDRLSDSTYTSCHE